MGKWKCQEWGNKKYHLTIKKTVYQVGGYDAKIEENAQASCR